ncbi:disease resistance protein RUN1-like [Quercus robur]|uniref:disease resistance protein RUN1-like n=1 Tax=Quercus robur TaxID=38942 RepID=UPI00216292C1|nr:disease resistance protein RUN1-like [Quercus robur]
MGTENASSSCFPSSSTSAPRWTYEYYVFLSFRGSDTRKKFTSHLYEALKRNGITTFRDDESLDRGAFIKPELLKAIEESKIAVVIFSRDYASSSWCLTELAKIVECMDKKKLTVLPVFHDVDPSDVRNLRGTFEDAFAKHLIDNTENVQTWKDAVSDVAGISGWDLRDEPESTVIEKIIQWINYELDREVPSVSEHLVGMESRSQQMLDLCLRERLDCVRFIGICGIGGIGKTTLAREIYNQIFRDFEASSFIYNIREESENQRLVSLQKQLLSKILMSTQKNISNVDEGINALGKRFRNKKVLIVLDDVNKEKQLKALAGKDEWFGVGSIIIVTSRDRHLLRRHGVKHIYEAKELNDDEALKLFSWKAFKKPHPEENYVDLSKHFVRYAGGLPLALEELGSSLFGRKPDAWRSALDKLEAKPNRRNMEILQNNLDGLDDTQRELFLDIACFFKEWDIHCARNTLESLGHYPGYDIDVLLERSLITILSNETLWMHDLLQKMGQDIVHCESPTEPGRRSRLWCYKDVLHVLKNNTGTKFVKGIVLDTPADKMEQLSAKAFSKLKNLRYLKIRNVQLPQGLSYFSNELRVIDWHEYPLKSLPTSFQPNNLVELRMHCSGIKQLWKGNMILNELKLIDLSDSQNLIETPDLSGAPNLKQLILRRCTGLCNIHASLGDLKRLILLDLNKCKCLESLPHNISFNALETFILSGCSRLKKFPEVVGNILYLSKLSLKETAIKDLPFSVKHIIGLTKLDLRDCKNLSSLPSASCLMSLKILILSGCSKLVELPENIGEIKGMEELDGRQDDFYYKVVIPGSEIPKWFSHQNVGASMNLQVPPNLLCNKLMGIAVCAVFVFRQHHPLHQLHFEDYGHMIGTHDLWCSVGGSRREGLILSEEFGKIESYQLCLRYFPFASFGEDWKEILNKVNANGFSQIEVKFEAEGPGLEVTKCGAQLVFERDIEDLNQTKAGPSNCIITPYDEDGFDDS